MVPTVWCAIDAHDRRERMKVKTNLRAGSGGASGGGKNSQHTGPDVPEVEVQPVYVPPVSRCAGY
jgi:hypothetical protein